MSDRVRSHQIVSDREQHDALLPHTEARFEHFLHQTEPFIFKSFDLISVHLGQGLDKVAAMVRAERTVFSLSCG